MTRIKHTSILLIIMTVFMVRGFSMEPGEGGTQSENREQALSKVDVKKELILFEVREFAPLRWSGLQFNLEKSVMDFPNPNSISNHYFVRPEIRTEFRLARFMENRLQLGFTKLVIAF